MPRLGSDLTKEDLDRALVLGLEALEAEKANGARSLEDLVLRGTHLMDHDYEEGGFITAATLQTTELEPLGYIVPEILPVGMTVFAGKPKVGKSWMTLDLAVAVADGDEFLGRKCDQGDVILLALEDNLKRIQKRLNLMFPNRSWPKRLFIQTWAKKLGGELEFDLEACIEANPDLKLVIVDTLGKVKPESKSGNAYDYDEAYRMLARLKVLADDKGVGIVLVHHGKKGNGSSDPQDDLLGSTGIAGAADTTWMLSRERNTQKGNLWITGRDIESEGSLDLVWQKDQRRWAVGIVRDWKDTVWDALVEPHTVKELQALIPENEWPTNAKGDLVQPSVDKLKTLLDKWGDEGTLQKQVRPNPPGTGGNPPQEYVRVTILSELKKVSI